MRPGADEGYVEGVFALPPALAGSERIADGAQEVVLARRVWPDGRTRAYVSGRSATLADLQELGAELMSFYGQHEHRRLMLQTAQLDLLDAFCGEAQARLRTELRAAYDLSRDLEARAAELRELAGRRERELDLVLFELAEIEDADPSVEEETTLTAERERLRHLEALQRAAAGAAEAIAPESGDGARELLSGAAYELEAAAGIDPALGALAQRLQALRYEAEDIAGELRGYLRDVTGEAAAGERLEEIETRLALLHRLERKHGAGIEEVLAHADRCRARRDELEHADQALEAAEQELHGARAELERLAVALGEARRAAAPELAAAVRERLAELSMPDARFEIELAPRADGCGPRGAEAIEMQIAANAGGPLGPLREVASGGELSRVMLALMSVAESGRQLRTRSRRCSCSTRSTPGSAATRPARSASTCARYPGGVRSSASPTSRRWRRSRSVTSRSSRRRAPSPPRRRSRCSRATASSASWCGCSAPAVTTARPPSTRASCCAPPEQRLRGAAALGLPVVSGFRRGPR